MREDWTIPYSKVLRIENSVIDQACVMAMGKIAEERAQDRRGGE